MAYGIKETKEVLDLGFGLGMAIKGAMADGKIGLEDLAQLMAALPLVQPAIDQVALVPKELGELDSAEVQQLIDHVKVKLPMVVDDAALRVKIEQGLKLGLAVAQFVAALKA